ncbi:hypothetical protein [Spirosoma arcticum]
MNQALHKLIPAALLLLGAPIAQAQSVFINELIYDSTILVEGRVEQSVESLIEIAGPAGTNLKNWSLVMYDGENSAAAKFYTMKPISGIIPNQQNGFGTLAFRFPGNTLQRGPRDGIAVVDGAGKVVQLISYEGKFTAGNGPAKDMVSDPIRPSHGGSNGKQSLQLQGRGRVYKDFIWSALFDFTPGEVNNAFINNKQMFTKP